MKNTVPTTIALLGLAAVSSATDVDIDIQSGGANLVQVQPGAIVDYQILIELTDAENEGLALLCFDLAFDGGALDPAVIADSPTVRNFESPLGLSNPAGFGGTPSSGVLLQVGGSQNTIKNSFAPQPKGTVIPDVALPGSPLLFVTGTVVAPSTAGSYVLSASEVIANVIRLGETGSGSHWAVDRAGEGTLNSLTVEVHECAASSYCVAKRNSLGCVPAIGWSGTPTLSGPDDFHLTATQVLNNQFGLVLLSRGPADVPFMGGTRCLDNPLIRTYTQLSGGSGSGNDCTGSYDYPFTQADMASLGLAVGDAVYAQYWSRDPQHPDGYGIGLSDAASFSICP